MKEKQTASTRLLLFRIWVCLKLDGVVLKNPLVDHVNHHFTMQDRP
jgi:hypothetical protein